LGGPSGRGLRGGASRDRAEALRPRLHLSDTRRGTRASCTDEMWEGAELTVERDEPLSPSRLAELYERHVGAAMRLSYLLTGNQQQAEDLVQEAFVRCVGRFRHLRVPDAFESYLRRTIVNLHTSGLRRKRLERAWLAREAGRVVRAAPGPDVADRA